MQPVKITPMQFKRILRALQHRNYRLFYAGQSISLIGTWMQRIAMSWLVYRLTGSTFLLGVVGFASQIPTFLLAPFTGVLIDRYNRHRILIITQTLAMIQALALALLILTKMISIPHIILLSVFIGLVNAFDMPARQSFLVDMVEEKEDLGNAIALNSSMVNAARLLGPSIAGMLIAAVGEGMCFLLNSVSYVAVIIALYAMKITPRPTIPKRTNMLMELREGFAYAFDSIPIRSVLMLLGLISLMGMPYSALMPVFAENILRGGPHTLGFLMGASGLGALSGAIFLAARQSVLGLEKVIILAATLFGAGLMAFALSRVLWLSLALMVLTGFGMMVQMAASNTVLQTRVDDDKRGRVMSLYTMAFMGTVPFGSLFAGSVASRIGAPNTLMIGGMVCILGACLFFRQLSSFSKIEGEGGAEVLGK
jgi:MFS family permease